MLKNIEHFKAIKEKHAEEILLFLLNSTEEFDILCSTSKIFFNPKIPEPLSNSFGEIILFSIANYTLQSSKLTNKILTFEAGFGEENFASTITVPISAILQISKEETPLFVNITATLPKPKPKKSKNPFELNPRNKKFMNE